MMCFLIGSLISLIYRGVSFVNEKVGDAHYEAIEELIKDGNLAGAFVSCCTDSIFVLALQDGFYPVKIKETTLFVNSLLEWVDLHVTLHILSDS
jgi:hypothetical protein